MRFSEAWLRKIVNPEIDTEQLVEQLTMAGLEVDSVEPAAPSFSKIVVGEVQEITGHPDADKLQVCKVNAGSELLQIVCGARNVYVGMKAPVALVGAVLPGNFKIKKSKLRGVESFGMLCSEAELGLAETAEGLMDLPADAPAGEDIRTYLNLEDQMIEVDLTPNRADCLSIEGVAREVGLLNKTDCKYINPSVTTETSDATVPVTISAPDDCPVYLARVIEGLNSSETTPLWMQERLRRSDLRSLGPVIDVTNYVLLELGQPLHAFDAAKVEGGIEVRLAGEGESLELLNEQTITLDDSTLVIADQNRPLALAGVMGGNSSAVSSETDSIILECAFFNPSKIMGKARRYGLHTDSSHRFERGVDPALQERAINRATELILEICGGKAGAIVSKSSEHEHLHRKPIFLRSQRVELMLGVAIEDHEIVDIIQRLGMQIDSSEGGWVVTPPSFRFDISIEADLIEELGRVYGYDNIPKRSLLMRSELKGASESATPIDRVKNLLVDRGYQEAITYSFVDEALQKKLLPELAGYKLKNPLSSELSVMRMTIWAGLLGVAERNLNRQQSRLQLFESGLNFIPDNGEIRQESYIAGLITGPAYSEQWGLKSRSCDFYDLKSDVEAILALSGKAESFKFLAATHPALHPGQTAKIVDDRNELVGWIGMLHPSLKKELGFEKELFLFELKQSLLLQKEIPAFNPLSKFPQVRRDIALIVKEQISYQQIQSTINSLNISEIRELVVFDVYRGQGVESGRKSIALGLILQDYSKTLVDSDIDAIVVQVLERLEKELDANLRE